MGPAARVKAVETYEWLTGKAFIVHRFEGRVGDAPAASIEVIGPVTEGASFPVRAFYDSGIASEWQLKARGTTTWVVTRTWPIAGRDAQVRCTIIDGGDEMTARWEYAINGGDWQVSWDIKSRRRDASRR
jgi:hypothetical protein